MISSLFPIKHTKAPSFLSENDQPENFRYENRGPLHISTFKASTCHKFQSFILGHPDRQKAYLGTILWFQGKQYLYKVPISFYRKVNLDFHTQNCHLLLKPWQWWGRRENGDRSFQECPLIRKLNNTQRTGHHNGQRQRYSFPALKRSNCKAELHFLRGIWSELLYLLANSLQSFHVHPDNLWFYDRESESKVVMERREGKALPLRCAKAR